MKMSVRIITLGSLVACIAVLGAAIGQHKQVSGLRAAHQAALSERETKPAVEMPSPRSVSSEPAQPPGELLRVRGEVSRLRMRQRELADVVEENSRLRAQVEQRQANASTNLALPPGYKLRSQARFVGYGTPEQTLESFLGAIHSKDTNALFTALTPESSENVARQMTQPSDTAEMFKELAGLAGMLVVDRRTKEDGAVELQVEVAPGLNTDRTLITFFFRQAGGEWKLDLR